MLAALALILPLGLASAVGPMMLTEQTVLLAGPGGRRAASGYAAGVVLATVLLVAAILLFGRAVSLPAEPRIDARLDLLIGAVLLAAAAMLAGVGHLRRPSVRSSQPAVERFAAGAGGVLAAFALGVVAVATNLTGVPLIAAAAKEISASGLDLADRLALGAVLVALGSAPAWAPLTITRLAPRRGARLLDTLGRLLREYGRTALIVVLAAAGSYFAVRGAVRLLG